jgi:hypothetical protein
MKVSKALLAAVCLLSCCVPQGGEPEDECIPLGGIQAEGEGEGEPGPEDSLAACLDGFDNDGDGFTDCQDFSCSRIDDADIIAYCASIPAEDSLERCSNGLDDDRDGFVDCNAFSCSQSQDLTAFEYCRARFEGTDARCADGIDNDGDCFVDCDDFTCRASTVCD